MIFYDARKIDPNKKYNFVVGKRKPIQAFRFEYFTHGKILRLIGDDIRAGYSKQLTGEEERKVNAIIVDLIQKRERMRKNWNQIDKLYEDMINEQIERKRNDCNWL